MLRRTLFKAGMWSGVFDTFENDCRSSFWSSESWCRFWWLDSVSNGTYFSPSEGKPFRWRQFQHVDNRSSQWTGCLEDWFLSLSLPLGHSQKAQIDDWWVIDLSVLYSLSGQGPDNQNGFLLRRDIHSVFDNHLLCINIDVSLQQILLSIPTNIWLKGWVYNYGVEQRQLRPRRQSTGVCRDPADPHHVSDKLLRWRWRTDFRARFPTRDWRGEGASRRPLWSGTIWNGACGEAAVSGPWSRQAI